MVNQLCITMFTLSLSCWSPSISQAVGMIHKAHEVETLVCMHTVLWTLNVHKSQWQRSSGYFILVDFVLAACTLLDKEPEHFCMWASVDGTFSAKITMIHKNCSLVPRALLIFPVHVASNKKLREWGYTNCSSNLREHNQQNYSVLLLSKTN